MPCILHASLSDFVRVGCAVCGRADILARIADEAVSAAFVAQTLHGIGLLAAPLPAASVADFSLARRGANFATSTEFAESADDADGTQGNTSVPPAEGGGEAAESRIQFAPHVAIGDERSVRRPRRVVERLDYHNIELE